MFKPTMFSALKNQRPFLCPPPGAMFGLEGWSATGVGDTTKQDGIQFLVVNRVARAAGLT